MKMLQMLRLSEAKLDFWIAGSKSPRRGVTFVKTTNKTQLGEQSRSIIFSTNIAPLRGET
jgi:hypothetical protein